MAILLVTYRDYSYTHTVLGKEAEMAFAMEREVDMIDYSLGEAMSTASGIGAAFSLYAFRYNQNQIISLMKDYVSTTDVTDAWVCNLEGSGYDYNGKDVHIGDEEIFKEITAEYSRGGTGLVLSKNQPDENVEVYIVDGVSFDKKERGYLIARTQIASVADQIFSQRFMADCIAIINMDGMILSIESRENKGWDKNSNFYDILPFSVSKENVKLSISQKSIYYAEAPGYGYYIVVPMDTANGGVVALVDYEQMKFMANEAMRPFDLLCTWMVVASIALGLLIPLSYAFSDFVVRKSREKRYTVVEKDVLTGLLSTRSAFKAIDEYITSAEDKKGILFLIGVNLEEREIIPDKIKDFADVLSGGFRSTDILGRTEDNLFLVFLKDVREDKDIRRQTDHMQLFLHDCRIVEDDRELTANAGGVICPEGAKTAREAFDAAREALDRSRQEGPGRVSF
jgi:GGDEF domain-containing protein